MGFGNYTYFIYISATGALVLAVFILYVLWRRRVVSSLLSHGGLIQSMVKGSRAVKTARSAIIIISIVLSVFVMLRPQWGEGVREASSEGTDLIIALDVSRSMLARDVVPTRLDRAKSSVRWIMESLRGDRIGLILFAGDAFLQCPLTSDMGAFMMFLDSAGPGSVNVQGTDIGSALDEAMKVFRKKRLTSKILVLITDGEDHEGNIDRAVRDFRDLGVSVYPVGIGRDNGTVIPSGDDDKSGEIYYRDRKGELIKTRKNTGVLSGLAASTGGTYIDITDSLSGMKPLINAIEGQQRNNFGNRVIKEPREQYAFFALILAALLSAELLLYERRG